MTMLLAWSCSSSARNSNSSSLGHHGTEAEHGASEPKACACVPRGQCTRTTVLVQYGQGVSFSFSLRHLAPRERERWGCGNSTDTGTVLQAQACAMRYVGGAARGSGTQVEVDSFDRHVADEFDGCLLRGLSRGVARSGVIAKRNIKT